MLGLLKGQVVLADPDPAWTDRFLVEERALRNAVGDMVLGVQHVGSTSIPGMVAKPILDIAVAVSSFEKGKRCVGPIESLGYEYRGEHGVPRRHYFVKGVPRTHHVHMVEVESFDWRKMIAFRDVLRDQLDVADEYARLKRRLASEFPNDRQSYQDGKANFIENVLSAAGVF